MLFDSTSLKELQVDNRVGLAPMTRVSATEDGRATDRMARYYAKFAEGGFSFLVTEGVYTDSAYSKGYLNQPGLVTRENLDQQALAGTHGRDPGSWNVSRSILRGVLDPVDRFRAVGPPSPGIFVSHLIFCFDLC